MGERRIDEVLEALWSLEEEEGKEGAPRPRLEALLPGRGMEEAIEEAVRRGLLKRERERLLFAPQGRLQAREVIRCHRLAERLFHDVLDLSSREVESGACKLEHLLSPQAASSICILLGHPTTCPHGKPIPSGECCRQGTREIRPLVIRASQLKLREEATVAYIGTREWTRLEQLNILGIIPGNKIRLEQRYPSFVLRVDETLLGLDDAIVDEIYVRRLQ